MSYRKCSAHEGAERRSGSGASSTVRLSEHRKRQPSDHVQSRQGIFFPQSAAAEQQVAEEEAPTPGKRLDIIKQWVQTYDEAAQKADGGLEVLRANSNEVLEILRAEKKKVYDLEQVARGRSDRYGPTGWEQLQKERLRRHEPIDQLESQLTFYLEDAIEGERKETERRETLEAWFAADPDDKQQRKAPFGEDVLLEKAKDEQRRLQEDEEKILSRK